MPATPSIAPIAVTAARALILLVIRMEILLLAGGNRAAERQQVDGSWFRLRSLAAAVSGVCSAVRDRSGVAAR
ncbi:hypothetical protein GCM10009764_75370 [Nocardia ninae]|uniref:Uncharacterized protein n=1 Tax=Nocardia ninae NBRC 108245 TaxID=1210091 RepID=A0A511MGJ8_9NOCA|nr:hypothetical protein NN4_43320 [Nocardia ninae NBRC 108245]